MEDSKTIDPPLSPNVSASGTNENESENHRNSQQKSKNFMSPTISAPSKFISPKKRILSEWKPKNLESKSDVENIGTSNLKYSSNSRNCLPKIPSNSSPKNTLPESDENFKEEEEEEEGFVPESCSVPYDPLTNYLSPRPKFLRYNPNRKLMFLQKESKIGSLSTDLSVDYCQSSCNSECSSIEQDLGGKNEVEVEEEEKEKEEEVLVEDERNSGLKWVFSKSLIVFFAWLFLTMYICSMNCSESTPIKVTKVEYDNFINITFGAVSFVSVEPRNWMIDEGKVYKNDEFGVDDSSEGKKVKFGGEIAGSLEDEKEEELSPEEEKEEEEERGRAKLQEYEMNRKDYIDEEIEDSDEFNQTVNWVPDVSPHPVAENVVAPVVEGEDEVKMQVSGVKSADGVTEQKKVDDFVPKTVNDEEEVVARDASELKSEDGVSEMNKEEDVVRGDASELKSEDGVSEMNKEEDVVRGDSSELKSEDGVSEMNKEEEVVKGDSSDDNESEANLKDETEMLHEEEEEMEENAYMNARLTQLEFIILAGISVVAFVGFAVFKCYGNCRRKSRSSSSRKAKLLPVRAEEEADQIHVKTGAPQVNLPPRPVVVGEATGSRIVPMVKQLGEVDFGGGSQVASGRMQEEASVFSVPDDRKAKRNKWSSGSTTSESHSYSSNLPVEGKEKVVSAVRRSKRLQDRVPTSP